MSDLIVAAFTSEAAAIAARDALVALQRDSGEEPEDIVLVMRSPTGGITLEQSVWLASGMPLGGGRWGMLIGALFLDDRAPAKKGKEGLSTLLHKSGLDADFLKDVSRSLQKEGAAVGIRVRKLGAKAVMDRLSDLPETGRIMHRSLGGELESGLEGMLAVIPEYVPKHLRDTE